MGVYIALLRGVNLGGHRKVPMAELRALAQELGYARVRTYIQSGNLIFQSDKAARALQGELEQAIAGRFGCDVPVAIRTPGEIEAVLREAPFEDADGAVVYVFFAVEEPAAQRVREIPQALPSTEDECRAAASHVYVRYHHGVHLSPLSNTWLERRLGVPLTARSISTVRRLLEMAR